MVINKETVKSVIGKLLTADVNYGKYGNGSTCEYRRTVIDGVEFTLVGEGTDKKYLYAGHEGATVSRIKENRPETQLCVNGKQTEFASLIANSIIDTDNYFCTFGEQYEIK